jgi:hypothetical protein
MSLEGMFETMPETPAPKKPYIRFAVPDELLKDAQEIAATEGFNEAEFHRMVWTMGLNAYAESANKRLVWKRLQKPDRKSEEG